MASNVDWKDAFLSKDAYCNDLQRAHAANEQKIKDLQHTIKNLLQTIRRQERTIARLQSIIDDREVEDRQTPVRIDGLEARILRGIQALGRDWDVQREAEGSTWLEDLQEANYSPEAVRDAYPKACRANNESSANMSPHCLRYRALEMDDSGEPIEFDEMDLLVCDPAAHFRRCKRGKFDFARLLTEAPEVMAKIVEYTMKKDDPLHVVFRLDKYDEYPPRQGGLDPESHLPFRFFWEQGACAVNSAPLPQVVLAPLLVNRTWLEIFGTCFYGTNTFSFQSLGEFDLFFKKLAATRRQRIQHIELWWIGSAMPKGNNGYERTWALRHFVNLRRLKTLKIFLNESKWIRRPNEPEHVRAVLERFTKHHSNNRMHRDLRAIRGKDYVYQLRGIRTIQIFDFKAEEDRTQVRDDTFIRDMKIQVKGAKSYGAAKNIRVEKLQLLCPVLRGWVPTQQVMALLRKFMDNVPIPNSHAAAPSIIDQEGERGFGDAGVGRRRRSRSRDSGEQDSADMDDGSGSGRGSRKRRRREICEWEAATQRRPQSQVGDLGSVSIKKSSSSSPEVKSSEDDIQSIGRRLVVVDLTDDDVKEESIEGLSPFDREIMLRTVGSNGSVDPQQNRPSPHSSRLSRSFSNLFVSEGSPNSRIYSSMNDVEHSESDPFFPLGNGEPASDVKTEIDRPRRVLEAQLARMRKRASS